MQISTSSPVIRYLAAGRYKASVTASYNKKPGQVKLGVRSGSLVTMQVGGKGPRIDRVFEHFGGTLALLADPKVECIIEITEV